MAKLVKMRRDVLFPACERDVPSRFATLPATAFLGENPLSETHMIAGSADETLELLFATRPGGDPAAASRARVLYAAWLDFYRGRFQEAQDRALDLFERISESEVRAAMGDALAAAASPDPPLGQAAAAQQTDPAQPAAPAQKLGAAYLICNLARYGMPRYRIDEAATFMKELAASELRIAQAASINLAMHEMSLGVMSDVPLWVRAADFGVARAGNSLLFNEGGVYPENLYAAVTAAAQYANYRGNYLESLNIVDAAERVLGVRGYLIGDAYFALYRALNCEALGFPDEADAYLQRALHLVQPDGFWQIVSQFDSAFEGRLVRMAENLDAPGGLRCRELAEGFIDRVQASHEEEKELRGHQKLTSQELAVMQLLAQGKKGTEVAEELFIEPVTVKFHKKNAVRKLGIHATANIAEIQAALERYEISAAWLA